MGTPGPSPMATYSGWAALLIATSTFESSLYLPSEGRGRRKRPRSAGHRSKVETLVALPPAPRHGFGPRGHLPRRLRFWRRVPRGKVICLCFLHLSVNSCAISWFPMFPWRKWFQEKEATKDLTVYLIDASPKMFAPVTALVSSSLSSTVLRFLLVYYTKCALFFPVFFFHIFEV